MKDPTPKNKSVDSIFSVVYEDVEEEDISILNISSNGSLLMEGPEDESTRSSMTGSESISDESISNEEDELNGSFEPILDADLWNSGGSRTYLKKHEHQNNSQHLLG